MTDPMVNVYEIDPATGAEQLVYRPMTNAEYTAWQSQVSSDGRVDTATTAAAWVQLRLIRDRWLAQTDYVDLYLANPSAFNLPSAIATAISGNGSAWQAWRQALRDLPAQSGLDPVAAVAAAASIHATSDTFPAPWPQPPAGPVVHLT